MKIETYDLINQAATLEKGWLELKKKDDHTIISVGYDGVHIDEHLFADLVSDQKIEYSVIERKSDDFKFEYQTKYNGVTFYCISNNKHLIDIPCAGEL